VEPAPAAACSCSRLDRAAAPRKQKAADHFRSTAYIRKIRRYEAFFSAGLLSLFSTAFSGFLSSVLVVDAGVAPEGDL
jgi:hypothetical protein